MTTQYMPLEYKIISPTISLEHKILKKIEHTIETYNMFDNSDKIFVALSGGKDSVATAILLSKLGYKVIPISIDTGDTQFDSRALESIGVQSGFLPEIHNFKNGIIFDLLSNKEQEEVLWRLDYLASLPMSSNASCTHCYFIKMYALYSIVNSMGGDSIVLGQHLDDMIDSFLKCYWIDLYYREITLPTGLPYDGALMKDLMQKHKIIDIEHLNMMVENELAATDEPFVEGTSLPNEFLIYRPLGEVPERDIILYLSSLSVEPAGDFCIFKKNWTETSKAFRLIVHDDYIKRVQEKPGLEYILHRLILSGLNERGTWKFRPRNDREKNYPGFKPFIKKL